MVFLQNLGVAGRFPLVFVGWDSAWYLSIMTKGYAFSAQSYTFSPALPFFGMVANLVLQSPMISIALTTLFFGVLWIPLYQLLAEEYMGKKAALMSALLLAFSPYLFLFTTVAYSEGLLLFFTLGAWLLLKKGKVVSASILAAVAPLTRTMGVLVMFPMLYSSLKQKPRKIRNIVLSLVPIASLSAWFGFFSFTAGDWLAPMHTTEWSTLYSFRTLIFEGIPQKGIEALMKAPFQLPPITSQWLLPLAVVLSLIVPLLLLRPAWKLDKSLWMYAVAGYGGILFFGALVSTPRFVSVLFPLWIPLTTGLKFTKRSIFSVTALTIAFYIVTLALWMDFLNGQFVS